MLPQVWELGGLQTGACATVERSAKTQRFGEPQSVPKDVVCHAEEVRSQGPCGHLDQICALISFLDASARLDLG